MILLPFYIILYKCVSTKLSSSCFICLLYSLRVECSSLTLLVPFILQCINEHYLLFNVLRFPQYCLQIISHCIWCLPFRTLMNAAIIHFRREVYFKYCYRLYRKYSDSLAIFKIKIFAFLCEQRKYILHT